jgi:hypothetical protein
MADKATSSALIRLHKTTHDRWVKEELTFELAELDTSRNMAHVNSLHDILAINIRKQGEDDRNSIGALHSHSNKRHTCNWKL